MLKAVRPRYEAHHRVSISDEAVAAAVELSDLYIAEKVLPGKAFELIDEAAAAARRAAERAPPEVKEIEAQIADLTTRKEQALRDSDYDQAAKLRDKAEAWRVKREECLRRSRSAVRIVDAGDVRDALRAVAGAPAVRAPAPPTANREPGPAPVPAVRPEVFVGGADAGPAGGVAVILAPGVEAYDPLFDGAIRPAVEANGLTPKRLAHPYAAGGDLDRLRAELWTADLIVADAGGRDPGVLFALGVCAAWAGHDPARPRPADLPAGLRSGRCVTYDDTDAGIAALRGALTEAVRQFLAAVRARRDPE